MAITLTYKSGNAATITNTETSLAVDGGSTTLQTLTDKGLYQLIYKSTAMAKGDEFRLRVYEKASTGASKSVLFSATLSDVQSEQFTHPPVMLGLGWDMTAQRTGGSNRAAHWSIRRVSS
jgi:hypothetical protein